LFPVGDWQPICYYICMILVVIRMNVLSEKRLELTQTLAALSASIEMQKGCQRCDFCQSTEDENRLFVLEEWDSRKSLITHLKSKLFGVFRGAVYLLEGPYEIVFHTVGAAARMEGT